MYMATARNHHWAVRTRTDTHGGQASPDAESLALEVTARNDSANLFAQFGALTDGCRRHDLAFAQETGGFIGWLPCHPVSWKQASDKLAFKLRLLQAGLPTPRIWTAPENATQDYVVKHSAGVSSHALAGPFKAGTLPDKAAFNRLLEPDGQGSAYVEAFVAGRSMRVWFWGEHVFFAQLHSCAVIIGDGKHSAAALAAARLQQAGLDWETCEEKPAILQTLAYQGLHPETVLAAGRQARLDYRHGRALIPDTAGEDEDNVLPHMTCEQRAQVDRIGCALALDLQHEFGVPLLYCLDAVLDEQGEIWWLEMHSEPVLPGTDCLPMGALRRWHGLPTSLCMKISCRMSRPEEKAGRRPSAPD
jgi:hypothetical protein